MSFPSRWWFDLSNLDSFSPFKEGARVRDLAPAVCFLESGCHNAAQAVLEFATWNS